MNEAKGRKWTRWWLAVVLVGGVGAGAWLGWTPFFTWYYLRGLAAATDADRATWAARVVSLDEAALPGLLDLLKKGEPQNCVNAVAALSPLLQKWGVEQACTFTTFEQLTQHFPTLSEPGREAVVELQLALLRDQARPGPVIQVAERLLQVAAASTEPGVRLRTLALAEVIVDHASPAAQKLIADLARAELKGPDAGMRVQAIHLTLHKALAPLLDHVLPLLRDRAPEVRRAALLAVGLASKVISDEELVPLLHDEDKQVRQLCESALRGRGLKDRQVLLARLITDQCPLARGEVVLHLRDADDLDAGRWLVRLTYDPAPSVRIAACRAAAELPDVDLRERLAEMARTDPHGEVQAAATYYLNRLSKSGSPGPLR